MQELLLTIYFPPDSCARNVKFCLGRVGSQRGKEILSWTYRKRPTSWTIEDGNYTLGSPAFPHPSTVPVELHDRRYVRVR